MSELYNLGDLVDRTRDTNKVAYIDLRDPQKPREYTHGEIDRQAKAVARSLVKRGLRKGARIGILAWNRAEFAIAYFGITRAGYVAVPINTKVPNEIVDYIIDDAGIALVFVDTDHAHQVKAGIPSINFDDPGPSGFTAQLDDGAFETHRPESDEIAEILYTSGSTGRPKGVPLSHKGQLWMMQLPRLHANSDESRFIVAQPLFHMAGLFAPKRTILLHATLVILPGFDQRQYIKVASDYRVTSIGGVPTLLARIIKEEDLLVSLDLSSIKQITLGSAPLTIALQEKIAHAFPQARVSHGYGSTEAGGGAFGEHPDGLPNPPISVGTAHPEIDIKLVDGPHENEGVLLIRSPAVFKEYLNLPELTAKVFRDGWFYTGDIMRRDENGFYFFVGRADDMFVCGGENIYPSEVEKLLERHPAIHQASVVPLPDEERSQVPVAFIVPHSNAQLDVETVKRFALENGPTYQYPRRIEFVAELPLGRTNKIDRNALKERARRLESSGDWSR